MGSSWALNGAIDTGENGPGESGGPTNISAPRPGTSEMGDPIQVLLISGSIRRPSYTRTLTTAVGEALAECGSAIVHWDLRDSPLPIADPAFHDDPMEHTDERVRSLAAHAASSDALVLSSPIYHNSYSGVIKNALDHLTIAQFYHKPVGLISHGGDRSPQAVDHLRIVVRGLLGIASPTHVCTGKQDYREVCEGYELVSEEILQRIKRFAAELVSLACLLSPCHPHL